MKEPEGGENGQGMSHEGKSGNPGVNMDEIEREVLEKLGGPEEVNQAEIFCKSKDPSFKSWSSQQRSHVLHA